MYENIFIDAFIALFQDSTNGIWIIPYNNGIIPLLYGIIPLLYDIIYTDCVNRNHE